MAALPDQAFIGLDIGKTHHWVCALRAHPGEGKTDAKDAYVIAETARIRGICR